MPTMKRKQSKSIFHNVTDFLLSPIHGSLQTTNHLVFFLSIHSQIRKYDLLKYLKFNHYKLFENELCM